MFKASATLGHGFFGPVEIHNAHAREPGQEHNMGRLASEPSSRDLVLHYVERVGEYFEIAWG